MKAPSAARPSLLSPAEYLPRKPHETVLYGIVREHLATFLEHTACTYKAPLPRYVVNAFENYLGCGDVARGFLRCHCGGCGHDVLVAFSCKARGICPSCGARRMCNEAVQIVDRVLPNVPIRQWVLSLPWELRGLVAAKRGVLGAMDRIFAEEIARVTKRLANVDGAATGSIGIPQIFGGSFNLNPHLHTLAVDGVFEKTAAGGVRFHEAPAPSKDDVAEVAKRVRDRAVTWLRRHRYLDERAAEERSNEAAEPSALEGCAQLALAGGAFLARPFDPKENRDADLHRKERRFSAATDGFDVHCAVRIEANDDQGRERLVRYCTRPPFALDRLTVLRDGRIAYELSAPRKGCTHRVMTPMEFMARLAAFVPHPKIPFVRYHGVFSSRSSWRKLVTPKPPAGARVPMPKTKTKTKAHGASPSAPSASPSGSTPAPASPAPSPALALANAPAPPGVTVDPTLITVAHWGRLENGELFAWSSRLEWSVMMRRTFGFDVLVCPRCSRKMQILATITEPSVVRRILEHLRVRAEPLARAPARDPAWQQIDLGFDENAEAA